MKTDALWAHEVENNDFIVVNDVIEGYVYSVNDEGDSIVFDVVDEDGYHEQFMFGPFETVNIVASFEDDEADPE